MLDDRTGKTLEVYQLRSLKDRFRGSGQVSWDEVNRERRTATRTLREKWEAYGVPRKNIVIRWGYADQTPRGEGARRALHHLRGQPGAARWA